CARIPFWGDPNTYYFDSW
nr:immunoglobulin heavy chain junction region [Macaca mulatta]MOV55471.1 immunoglobulin heavy chain junction region [Macaca mulatta]MOV56999.1 immunoglobulin heavy chain junction region [Macaca mulatta]MOV60355.1 immunoglobulin heavy chain junction region [Macaca mulatta]MOV60685.1 immunoglobulin heavy chain junction region [Macaca mulatta]